ncbi:MAG: HTTM domain-containing protein [Rhodospirillaceae bacterium]|jgi:predicted DCC family thiol-disulfide oxidoreductase YuxK|nr:HTTM domain-containing protein [Rhodospirillaceae bacterium]MBT3931182.1 HTTM domain-containing protein [Rhodospirillaceae bacterium]MBT4773501.1 HTTM domain-containing protein [Rhodospirillaceae bacterium]MBT5358057.1 HTTM domain-containing protein [Rhodospirillaceae bacterium]MBT5769298.1 HTTM domain-containing protein [Rhodospirillaceae bacterium]
MTSVRDQTSPGLWRWAGLREIFAIDLRTLALFRIGLAVMIVADLILRARDLRAHYTDFGIMPRAVIDGFMHPASFSLHLMSGAAWFQALLFLLAGLLALLLMAGYRTRLVTVLSWVMLVSLQMRNPMILSGEDNLLVLLLFWAMFLPIGARYSVDAALDDRSADTPNRFVSIASAALLIQGMSMYLFSAFLKSDARWVPDGTAVYFALQLDYLVTPLALWFRQFEALLQGLTYYVWGLELIGPILIFSPILHRPLRALFQLAFMSMHFGFFLFLQIGLFPFVSILMNLTFTQGWVWDWLATRLRRPSGAGMVIYYDRDCDFCFKICRLLKTFLILSDAPIRPAQSKPDVYALMQEHDSWVVRDGLGRDHVRWQAMHAVFVASPVFFWLAGLIALRRGGDRIYGFVARNRGRLSRFTARALPFRSVQIKPSLPGQLLALGFTGFVLTQNLSTLPALSFRLGDSFIAVRQALNLYQNWTMFAPHPEITSPWPVIPGTLRDGTAVDVYNHAHGAPSLEKPAIVSHVYENYRWRKYLSNIEDRSYEPDAGDSALQYGRYLCRRWNEDTPVGQELARFEILFPVEWTNPPGQPKRFKTRRVWVHECFG